MATTCAVCKRSHSEEVCPFCTVTDVKVSDLTDKLHLQHGGDAAEQPTAFLVDLVSNRKIPITTPRCKVGRDDLNDIVISGDQSISRFHFVITKDSDQYMVQDSKSRHGTFLNGNQIAGPIPINDGDVLKVGVSLFWFVIENQVAGSSPDFSPVDIETIDAQEMKVSAGEKSTPYAPTRETDITTMTSLKEVLAKAKENAEHEEKTKTASPKDKEKDDDKQDDKPESKESKSDSKSDAKENSKESSKEESKNGESKGSKSDAESKSNNDKDSKDTKNKDKDKDDKEQSKKDESSENKDNGMQITASMLMAALEHESLSEVSKLEDPKDKEKEADKKEEKSESKSDNESKEESKDDSESDKKKVEDSAGKNAEENEKDEEKPSEKELQRLFSEGNGNLDKEGEKQAEDKDQESASSDKMNDSHESAEKAPEDKSKEESKDNNQDFSPDAEGKSENNSDSESKSTLDKMASAVQESAASVETNKDTENESKDDSLENDKSEESKHPDSGMVATKAFEQEIVEKTKNGAWSGNTMQDTKVPDWCSKYFASELNLLVKDLDNLNEQVRNAQNKIKEVENRLAATKSLRNTLLTATGEDLVEACGKVLARLGWRVKIVEDDKQELRLEADDKVAICRIIWTPGLPERTHLGQLSIAQTRYWCEQGAEPKGILIAAQAEDKPPAKLTDSDYSGELADYASKKNVLMFTTLQLLAMYKEIALNEGSSEALRSSIQTSNGWLKGYSLDPSDEDEKEPSKLASASA